MEAFCEWIHPLGSMSDVGEACVQVQKDQLEQIPWSISIFDRGKEFMVEIRVLGGLGMPVDHWFRY